jgi:hypothetical protein
MEDALPIPVREALRKAGNCFWKYINKYQIAEKKEQVVVKLIE